MIDSSSGVGRTTTQDSPQVAAPKKSLDQAAFLKLLTMQLAYQDPFKPVDNSQTLSQMTSMSTSEAISNLNKQMGGLNDLMTSSQALQASSLVGQQVLLPSDIAHLEKDGNIKGVIAVGDKPVSSIKITITDEKGQVIKDLIIDGQQKGNVPFAWDGTNNQGKAVLPGNYTIKAYSTATGGKSESLPALTYGTVESVTLGNSTTPTRLQLKGLGSVLLSDILQIAGSKSA